jgi:hypothetical protein
VAALLDSPRTKWAIGCASGVVFIAGLVAIPFVNDSKPKTQVRTETVTVPGAATDGQPALVGGQRAPASGTPESPVSVQPGTPGSPGTPGAPGAPGKSGNPSESGDDPLIQLPLIPAGNPLPDVTVPDVTVPQVNLPQVTVPPVSGVTVPTVPNVTVTTIPVTLPPTTIPGSSTGTTSSTNSPTTTLVPLPTIPPVLP